MQHEYILIEKLDRKFAVTHSFDGKDSVLDTHTELLGAIVHAEMEAKAHGVDVVMNYSAFVEVMNELMHHSGKTRCELRTLMFGWTVQQCMDTIKRAGFEYRGTSSGEKAYSDKPGSPFHPFQVIDVSPEAVLSQCLRHIISKCLEDDQLDTGELRDKYDRLPGHPVFCRDDWKYEVANEDTNLGYWEWVGNQMETFKQEHADALPADKKAD